MGTITVSLDVDTPDGPYKVEADWLIACDGARSPIRDMMGLDFEGRVFEDNFLIADVKMTADFPTERWFWFEPPFKNAGASALLHKQPDDIWRIDFQLGWEIDRAEELKEDNIKARVDAFLGGEIEYELEWTSIYTFQCRRMKEFRHGRVLFAGDSAHQVSPFGARGANSGMQDTDNLGLETRSGDPGAGTRQPFGQLFGRKGLRGGREHSELHPRDGFPDAEKRDQQGLPQCCIDAGAAPRLRAAHGEFGASIGALRL